jgi:hypothetical protein
VSIDASHLIEFFAFLFTVFAMGWKLSRQIGCLDTTVKTLATAVDKMSSAAEKSSDEHAHTQQRVAVLESHVFQGAAPHHGRIPGFASASASGE